MNINKLRVLILGSGGCVNPFIKIDIEIIKKFAEIEVIDISPLRLKIPFRNSLGQLKYLRYYERAKKADIIFAWWGTTYSAVLLSIFSGKPSIIVAGGSEVDPTSKYTIGKKNLLVKLLTRYTLKNATKVILVSNYNVSTASKIIKRDYVVVHLGVDSKKYKYNGTPKKKQIINIASTGNLLTFKRKGILELLEAFSIIANKYPQYKLLLLGPKSNRSIEIINNFLVKYRIEDKVRVIGYVDSIIPYLHESEIYVQPSKQEDFCLATLEAMAAGLPVLAANKAALPEVVGSSALFVDPDDANDIADKIEYLIVNKEMRETLGSKMEKRALDFSLQKREEKLKKIIFETAFKNLV